MLDLHEHHSRPARVGVAMSLPRFAVNQYICPPGFGLERFLDLAAEAGARAVGLTLGGIEGVSPVELSRMLRRRDLGVSSLNSAGFFTLEDDAAWREQSALNDRLIDTAAEIGAGALCVIAGGAEGRDLPHARDAVAGRLAALDERAAAVGVRLGLEPVHPAELLDKSCVNTIAQARALTAGLRATGLLVDLYHSWWDPDLPGLADAPTGTVLFQVCGVSRREMGFGFGREPLGEGFLDPAAVLRSACGAGYDGYFEFEMFARDLMGRAPEAMIELSARWYRDMTERPMPARYS